MIDSIGFMVEEMHESGLNTAISDFNFLLDRYFNS